MAGCIIRMWEDCAYCAFLIVNVSFLTGILRKDPFCSWFSECHRSVLCTLKHLTGKQRALEILKHWFTLGKSLTISWGVMMWLFIVINIHTLTSMYNLHRGWVHRVHCYFLKKLESWSLLYSLPLQSVPWLFYNLESCSSMKLFRPSSIPSASGS